MVVIEKRQNNDLAGPPQTVPDLVNAERRRTEQIYNVAAQLAKVAFWRWSFTEVRFTHWPDEYRKYFDCPTGTPQNYQEMLQPVHIDDRARVLQIYQQSDEGPSDFMVEYRIVSPDGQLQWLQELGEVEFNEQGEAVAHIGIFKDITESKLLEERLRESEERFKDYAEVSSDWFWEMDEELRFTSFSTRPGYVEGIFYEVIGKTRWESAGVDPDVDPFWREHKNILELRQPFRNFEFCVPRPHKKTMWVQVNGVPVYSNEGLFRGYRGSARDITTKIISQSRLRESEARYVDAAHLAKLGHWTFDEVEDKLRYCSKELASIHGMTPENFVATIISTEKDIERAHPNDREAYGKVLKDAQKNATAFNVEYRIIRPDGEVRYLREQGEPVCDNAGNLIKSRGTVQDITDLKRAEAQLIQSAKLASLGEMATGMAHEINQPLNIIRMSTDTLSEILEDGDIPPADFLKTRLERIASQIERASNIIDRMRIFGRAPAEQATAFSPQDAALGASNLLREQLRLDSIELQLDFPETCSPVIGDPILLEQVLLNLISNARDAIGGQLEVNGKDAGPDRVTVRVEDDPATSSVKVIVEDTGGGVPENVMPNIFDPFFTTKEVGKGTGVGLSISYGIIIEMGGSIVVANAGRGAQFTVSLPVSNEAPLPT